MTRRRSNFLSDLPAPLAYTLGWLLCAFAALELTQGVDGIAAVWPASGIFVAALLHLDRQRRLYTSVGVAIVSVGANLWGGVSLIASIGFTVANIVEGWLVFMLMGADAANRRLLDHPINLFRFAGAVIVASCFSALMAAVLSATFTPVFVTSWISTVGLGMLIVAPVILFVVQDTVRLSSLFSLRALWAFLLVMFASFAGFAQAEVPLLVLPLVAVSIATAMIGLSGAAFGVLLVAAIGSVLTALDLGPVGVFFPPIREQVLFFQVYVLALLISSLPVALILTKHRRNLVDLANANRFLEAAEEAAKVGHWRHDPEEKTIYWSAQARRLFEPDEPPRTLPEMVERFTDEDALRFSGLLDTALTSAVPFHFEGRIAREDGTKTFVECRTEVEPGSANGLPVLFGTIMDVTERALVLNDLRVATRRAEREAAEVKILAETDHLTGIANRRKILSDLREAIGRARKIGRKVSIAMVDIDHFKSINDRFGHEAGDQTLIAVAQAVRENLAGTERVGRMGGEEFLVLLPDADAEEVEERCKSLGAKLAQMDWPVDGVDPVTLSAGIAQLDANSDERDFLRAADYALYKAKSDGRAQCVVYDPSMADPVDI